MSTVLLVGQGCAGQHARPSGKTRFWDPVTDEPDSARPTYADADTGSDNRLTALSFNMQHRDRPRELAAMARHLQAVQGVPDFILCQEVLFRRPSWRGCDNTAGVLADELGYHTAGTDRRGSREGVAILSRYPFSYYDERHLKARTSPLLLGFARVSVMGEFIVPRIGRVRVVNTHLAYQPWEGHIRRKQLAETLAWLAEREACEPAAVTIFGGDFNLKPGAKALAQLSESSTGGRLQFINANTDWPTLGRQGHPTKRVDYIFISATTRKVRFLGERLLFADGLWQSDGTRRFYPSDHLPVLHKYAIGSGQGDDSRPILASDDPFTAAVHDRVLGDRRRTGDAGLPPRPRGGDHRGILGSSLDPERR
jgi:endonuclease/exonuclease/phosphatase family metal-dependent hydrolase